MCLIRLAIIMQLLTGCSYIYRAKPEQPRAVKGEIDLRQWDFDKDGPVWLEGEWAFFQGEIPANQITNELMATALFVTDKRPDIQDASVPWVGTTTWILKLRLGQETKRLFLKTQASWGQYNLYARDTRGTQDLRNEPFLTGNLSRLGADDFSVIDVLQGQVYLVKHLRGFRFIQPPTNILANKTDATRFLLLEWSERAFLFGAYSLVALVCFALFYQRLEEKLYLYSALVCAGLLIRYIATERVLGTFLISPSAGLNTLLLTVGTEFSLLSLLLILGELDPSRKQSIVIRGGIAATLLLLLVSVFFVSSAERAYYFYESGLIGNVFSIISLFNLGILVLVIQAVRRIRSWSIYLGLGSTIYMFGIIWDINVGLRDLGSQVIYIAHYCNLALCICLTLMTGKRFALTYAENQHLLEEVKVQEQARTLFFHNTSHELRTPLNGMIGFLQLLAQGRYGALPEAALSQIQKSMRLALSLKNQVNTILDLAKSKKGTLALSNSMFRLDALATEINDLATGLQLKRSDSSFKMHCQWNPAEVHFVNDHEKIGVIMRNLLGNAFKFADPQRPNHVEVKLERQGTRLLIEVSDSGIGIPNEQKDRIFEEFQQVAGDARRAYEGTGLGLAMVRDIIRLMGGTIELKTQLGAGSRFIVTIPEQKEIHLQNVPQLAPLQQHLKEKTAQESRLTAPAATQAPKTHGRILVVDDHELNCELLRDLLTEEGYVVSTALGGEEALRTMRVEHPDLVLLDMMMPFVSGEDVIKTMQGDSQLEDIAVILVTARASEDDRLFGLSLGADDYLAKPIHHEELMFRVKNILHRRELHYKVASLEEREKLAQLGQMMRDLSHELKNVFQRDLRGAKEEKQCGLSIIKRLPVNHPSWELAGLAWVEEKLLAATQVQTANLTFPSKDLSQSQALRYLRMSLAQLDINPDQRQALWKDILNLSPEEQIACDHAIHLVRSFLVLQDQVQYATELILNILEYSRTSNHNEACEISMVIPRVIKLIKPRLQRLGIQVEFDLKPWCLRIGSSQLMQITLNLLTNACDAIEEIPIENRFIRIVAHEIAGQAQLAFSNAGKPITVDQAALLFKESWSSKGNQGYGLGLAISQRLAQRVSGQLMIDEQAAHPCFILTLEWANTDALQNVG